MTGYWEKHNLLWQGLAVVGWTQQNLVVFCVVRFCFFFLYVPTNVKYLRCYTSHVGWWGIAPTAILLVTDASEMLHTSSSGDGVGVQTLTSRTGAWNGCFIDTNQNSHFCLCEVQFFTGTGGFLGQKMLFTPEIPWISPQSPPPLAVGQVWGMSQCCSYMSHPNDTPGTP